MTNEAPNQNKQVAQAGQAGQSTARDDFHPSHYPLISFPDEAWQWFIDACADLEIPVDDSRRAIVEAIYSHLVGVNAWLNLTRITAPADYLKFHVFDSLTVLNLVTAFTQPGDTIVDLGSGGGYPGLPLMTWLPERHWVLVDSRAKKAAFLKEAVKLTPCVTAEAFAFRGREAASACPALHHRCQIVVARAVGQADDLLIDAEALLNLNGVLILLKGQSYAGDEQHRFHHALGRHGFSLMEEQTIALDETDPDRWVVTAIKSEQFPHSTTKKSSTHKTAAKTQNKPKRQTENKPKRQAEKASKRRHHE